MSEDPILEPVEPSRFPLIGGARKPLLSRRSSSRPVPSERAYIADEFAVPLVSGVSATESAAVITGRTFSQIRVNFKVPHDRAGWKTARVWIKSFRANPSFVQMGEGKVSPIYLLLEPTSENLTIAVQSELVDGRTSDVEQSPTTAVLNDGV